MNQAKLVELTIYASGKRKAPDGTAYHSHIYNSLYHYRGSDRDSQITKATQEKVS